MLATSNEHEAGDHAEAGSVQQPTEQVTLERKKTKEERKEEYKPPPPPEPFGTWRKVLKDVWIGETKEVKTDLCHEILTTIYTGSENPFEDVLTLHKMCPDYSTQKSSTLAGFVVQYFGEWLSKCDRSELYERCLTPELKSKALEAATCKHSTHLQTIADIYKLNDAEMASKALDVTNKLLELKNYRDAVNCATIFGVQKQLAVSQIVVPCLLQNGNIAVEAYLKDHRDLQIELIRFFDNFVGLSDQVMRDRFKALHDRGEVPVSSMKMQSKTVEKMVSKLVVFYGAQSEEAAPNLSRCRQEGSLRYIVNKHFVDNNMSDESYSDYISQALKDDKHLQHYLVKYLCRLGHTDDAVHWAVYCDMGQDVPYCIKDYLTPSSIRKAEDTISRLRTEREDSANVYLKEGHPILMVDSVQALSSLANSFDESPVIGIDTEWKPMFMTTVEQVALLQISIPSKSYLVDVIKLQQEASEQHWTDFFKALFCSEASIKLGFDFANDLRVLRNSFPFLEQLQPEMKNVICAMKLVTSLMSENPLFIDLSSGGAQTFSTENALEESTSDEHQLHFRLADLSKTILGVSLDKQEQVGNWAIRPLRREQMKYAAMDAYCLIGIFDDIKKRAQQNTSVDWASHMQNGDVVQVKQKAAKKIKKKASKMDDFELQRMIERVNLAIQESSLNGKSGQRAGDVRIVVDSMMLGLGKHLRRCGIDTVLAESRDELVDCAKREKDRYILTSGKAYNELSYNRSLYGKGRILCIPALQSMSAVEQIEFVLKHFQIVLTREDIFSRCMMCNACSFVFAPAPVLEAMHQANVVALQPFNDDPYDADKFNQKMLDVNADDYAGYGCTVTINESDENWVTAKCYNGVLDVRNCVVLASNEDAPVVVQIEKVPSPVFEAEGRFFYVCGKCGKIYWDGCHIVNYNSFADKFLDRGNANIGD